MEEKTFTQEELNSIVSERLNKEKEKYSKSIEEYESKLTNLNDQLKQLTEQAANHAKELEERDLKIRGYETQSVKMRVAKEVGIPFELAEKLSGDDEESIKRDAEFFKNVLDTQRGGQPLRSTETREEGDSSESAYRQLAASAFANK